MKDNRFGVVRSAREERRRENREKSKASLSQNLGKLFASAGISRA